MKYMFLNEFIRNAGYSLSSLMLSAATNIPSVNGWAACRPNFRPLNQWLMPCKKSSIDGTLWLSVRANR